MLTFNRQFQRDVFVSPPALQAPVVKILRRMDPSATLLIAHLSRSRLMQSRTAIWGRALCPFPRPYYV